MNLPSGWVELGIGGVLAFILFAVLQAQGKRFDQVLTRQDKLIDQLLEVIQKNTDALTGVKIAIDEFRRFVDKLEARVSELEKRVQKRARQPKG